MASRQKLRSPLGKRASKVPVTNVSASKDEETRHSLAYKVLSADNTKKLMSFENVEDLARKVAEYLQLKDTDLDISSAVILDYYVGALCWCKDQSYTVEQTSAFFTVNDTLFRNLEKKNYSLKDNVQQMKKLMVGVGCPELIEAETHEVGGLQSVFDVQQAKTIANYIHEGLFQHYKLYQLFLHGRRQERAVNLNLDIEMPRSADMPWPAPLCESVREPAYQSYMTENVDEERLEEEKVLEDVAEEEDNVNEMDAAAAAAEETVMQAMSEEDFKRESQLLTKLTAQQIRLILEDVCTEMLSGIEAEVAAKLVKKENELLACISRARSAVRSCANEQSR